MRPSALLPRLGALAAALAWACATPRSSSTADDRSLAMRVRGEGVEFELRYEGADGADASRIATTLVASAAALQRWGAFREPVMVRVYRDHEALETAVARRGYPWLRAWAFADRILLQSPGSWSDAPGAATQEELGELLAHELTHSLMYQLIQPPGGSVADEPPLWFREGMASVTAGQGRRRLAAAELLRWTRAHPSADLLNAGSELYRTEKEAVYGAAHRAFELLLEVAGDGGVRNVLRGLRSGARFADAFAAGTGLPLSAFERETVRSGFAAAAFSTAAGAGGP